MALPDLSHHVFVYGTLRPGGYYHRRLLAGKPVTATPAWVRGRLYALSPGYPGLRPGENRVEGEVLSFACDGILAALDALEGFDPADPLSLKGEYTRGLCEAFAPEGPLLGKVWVYWILPSRLSEYAARAVERWDHRALEVDEGARQGPERKP
jgi:gamma-glutamylcyclotransferase (GGCT)/AIG2-like uncharacterized protein YtfP